MTRTRTLGAIFAQVYRGIGSRGFSSSGPGGNESIGRRVVKRSGLEILAEKAEKVNGPGLVPCILFGYACYVATEVVEARQVRQQRNEASKLRSQRRDELISKMNREMRGGGTQLN